MNRPSLQTAIKAALLLLPCVVSLASVDSCHAIAARACVTNQTDNTVSVINTVDRTVAPLALAAFNGPFGVAVAPAADYFYVVNRVGNNLLQLDLATSALHATYSTGTPTGGTEPLGVAVSPDSAKVYVAYHDTASLAVVNVTAASPTPEKIDLLNDTVTAATPFGVAVHPSGSLLFVTDDSSSQLLRVNLTTTPPSVSKITVGQAPKGVAATSDGRYVLVVNSLDSTVSFYDLSFGMVTTTVKLVETEPYVSVNPFGVAITPDAKYAYVTKTDDDSVAVINLATKTVSQTIPVGNGPMGISVTPNGKYVYVVNSLDGTVSVIDTATNIVLPDLIPVGAGPVGFGSFIGGKPAAPTDLHVSLVGENTAQLTWTDNADDEAGYRIERRKYQGGYVQIAEVGPDVESYTDPGLDFNANYYYRVYAYNDDGNSKYATVANSSPVTVEAEKSGCFIATAAYGSQMEPQVQLLREFRDRVLAGTRLGQAFISLYYEKSPPLARYIAEHDHLRLLVRWALLPLVGISWLFLTIGIFPALLGLGLLPVLGAVGLLFLKRLALSRKTAGRT